MITPKDIKYWLKNRVCASPFGNATLEYVQTLEQIVQDFTEKTFQLEHERDKAITLMREFAARINAGEDVSACEYCNKEFGTCNCNCMKEFELRDV